MYAVCPRARQCGVVGCGKFALLLQLLSLPLYLLSSKRLSVLEELVNLKGRGRQEKYTNKHKARTKRKLLQHRQEQHLYEQEHPIRFIKHVIIFPIRVHVRIVDKDN